MSKARPCALCTRRPRAANLSNPDLCPACYDYCGWENCHSDEGHDAEDPDAPTPHDCPICNHVPPPWMITEEPAVKNTKTRVNPTTKHTSHASCAHPRTPKGRAACRKLLRAGLSPEGHANVARSYLHVRAVGSKTTHLADADPNGLHQPSCTTKIKNVESAEVFTLTEPSPTCKGCAKLVPALANA